MNRFMDCRVRTSGVGLRLWVVLLLGWLLTIPVTVAAEKLFVVQGVSVRLEDVSDQVAVLYQSMRFNRASNVWNVEVILTNRSSNDVGAPLVLQVEGATGTSGPIQPDGWDDSVPPRPHYDLSDRAPGWTLAASAATAARTLTLGYTAGATPRLTTRVYARLPSNAALALARTLNEAGQPLPATTIFEIGPQTSVTLESDPMLGLVTLGGAAGEHTWKFDAAGYLPAWRRATLARGQVQSLVHPRLVPRSTNTVALSAIHGGSIRTDDGAIEIEFLAGALPVATLATLTPLTGQTLPALLPVGWSPLQAFWLELQNELAAAGTASVQPWGPVLATESVVLARWDSARFAWVAEKIATGRGTNAVAFQLQHSGAYVLAVGDQAPTAPPAATAGQQLAAATTAPVDTAKLVATGTVDPPSSPASRIPARVTATARVLFSSTTGSLASGTVLRGEVTEEYQLRDGTRRQPPRYENVFVAYQRPGDENPATLQATFPMRPQWLFGAEELVEARVRLDVLPPGDPAVEVVEPSGGDLRLDGIRLLFAQDTFARPEAIEFRRVAPTNYAELVLGLSGTVVEAFELSMASTQNDRRVQLQFDGLPPEALFVLGRVVSRDGWYGLEPRERLASDARGELTSIEPAVGERLPGLTSGGQYVLVQVAAAQGLVTGVARNAQGVALAGLPVRIQGQPWLTFTGAGGLFSLLAPAGKAEISVTDLATGDTGATAVTVVDPVQPLAAQVSAVAAGPRVTATTPVNGATGVSRVSPITVSFSEPINPDSLGSTGVQLLDATGQPVRASLTLNLRKTDVVLLPTGRLAPSASYTLTVSTSVTDMTGLRLEGDTSFTFTTERETLDRSLARLTSYEPDTNGMAALVGSPGTAEPEAPVILVNETTGFTATVLSRIDGSFSNSIPANVDDELSAVVVNANGTENTIAVSRQVYRDGSIGLFRGGGILEASTEAGPIQLILDPGSIQRKTRFWLEPMALNDVLGAVSNVPPTSGKVLGGFRYASSGDPLLSSPHLAFPVDLATLGIPEGADPTNATYALTVPREVDGEWVYEIIDRMQYEDGKLVTHSLPFLALLAISTGHLAATAGMGALIVAPCLIALGPNMVIAGQTVVGYADSELGDRSIPARALGGAVVTAQPAGLPFIGAPGRLPQGSYFCTSHPSTGHYSFLLPADTYDAEGGAVSLLARHPAFFGVVATRAVILPATAAQRVAMGNILAPVDIVFPVEYFAPNEDLAAPQIQSSHEPFYPNPGWSVELTVLLSDDASTPTASARILSVTPLVPGTTVDTNGVVLTLVSSTAVRLRVLRQTYELSCPTAARVAISVQASDAAGHLASALHVIDFGGVDSPSANPLQPADPRDDTGPMVLTVTPVPGGPNLAPGCPVTLRFSKPIDRAILNQPTNILMSPPCATPSIELSEDQTQLRLLFPDLQPGGVFYTMTLSNIRDLNGNRLDQDPTTPAADNFSATFETAPLPTGRLNGIDYGGGVVAKGIYAFALERLGTVDGGVVVYDLSNPTAPSKVAEFSLPGYPRDLVLIPQYAFQRRPDLPAQTNDLLAVVGGRIGYENVPGQYLWVLDISDPLHPRRIASSIIALGPSAAVTKIQWSPPTLGYLELGEVPSIGLVNLQSFIIGRNLSPTEFQALPLNGSPGLDLNGDGDYVDAGEELPMPASASPEFSGKTLSLTLRDTAQLIRDFSLAHGGFFVGVVVEGGREIGTGRPVAAGYRTLFNGVMDLPRSQASLDITNGVPARLQTLFNVPLMISNVVQLRDLALVSLRTSADSTTNAVVVIDITDRLAPRHIGTVPLPENLASSPFSIVRREDGLLALSTWSSLVLLDPSLLAEPVRLETASLHPAIVAVLPTTGVGSYSYHVDSSGLVMFNQGGINRVVQMAPTIEFVLAPDHAPFHPSTWTSLPEAEKASRISQLIPVNALRLSRFQAVPGIIDSTLNPPSPQTHYYVRVHAPGSAGSSIELAIESLDAAGQPLRLRGPLFPPVNALAETTLTELNLTPEPHDAPIRSCRAFRLSDNPASSSYNVYLSRPLVLVAEEVSRNDLDTLRVSLDREVLWSGAYVRASFDPSVRNNATAAAVLGAFASRTDAAAGVLRPGVHAVARGFPADYLHGPNPMPLVNAAMIPQTLGTVSTHNAGLHYSTVDLSLPGRRLPLEFRRTCNAQGLYQGPFGRGWDFNFHQRIIECRPEVFAPNYDWPVVARDNKSNSELAHARDILFVNGAGRVIVYRDAGAALPPELEEDNLLKLELGWDRRAARYYLPPPGLHDVFVKFVDGHYARLDPDGTQTWFDAQGRLIRLYDRYDGNSLELLYNAAGQLVRILDELRRPVKIGYWRMTGDSHFNSPDALTTEPRVAGLICCLEDYSGRRIQYRYSAQGLLESREGPTVSTAAILDSFRGTPKIHYLYSSAEVPETTCQSLIGVVAGDAAGTPLLAATSLGSRGRDVVDAIQVAARSTQIELGFANHAAALAAGNQRCSVTSPDGATTVYTLDARGHPTSVDLAGYDGPSSQTQTEYDSQGRVVRITYPEGNQVHLTYEQAPRRLRSQGNVIEVSKTPGPRGGATLTASASFDPYYNLKSGSVTNFAGFVTEITLTADHRDWASLTREGVTERFFCNAYGQLVRHEAADGIIRTWSYSSQGHLQSQSVGSRTTLYGYAGDSGLRGLPSTSTAPDGIITHFTYDERNHLVRKELEGAVTEFGFDEFNNLTTATVTVDDAVRLVETRSYNQIGFLLKKTVHQIEVDDTRKDLVTTFVPDSMNRVATVTLPGGEVQRFAYDHAGQLIEYRLGDDYREHYTYDRNGNRTSSTVGTATETYTYDGHDRQIRVTTPTGTRIEFAYDGEDNLLQKRVSDPGSVVLHEASYQPDAFGRYRHVTLARDSGTVSQHYDYDRANRTLRITDALGAQAKVTYDMDGRVSRRETPHRTDIFQYDTAGNLISRRTEEGDRVFTETYDYNSRKQLTQVTNSLGFTTTYQLGVDGRIKKILDAGGHETAQTFSVLGEVLSSRPEAGAGIRFTLNENRALTSISDDAHHATTQSYDVNGRLETVRQPNDAVLTYSRFNELGLPEQIDLPRGVRVELTYDSERRIKTRKVGSRTEQYSYDGLGRILKLSDPSGSVAFAYDKLGFTKSFRHVYSSSSLAFTVLQDADDGGFRRTVTYPDASVTVISRRDSTGRLLQLELDNGAPPIVSDTAYATDTLIATRTLGPNTLRQELDYDAGRHATVRRYRRLSDQRVVVDLRYACDPDGLQVARQSLHRNGRSDFFHYDPAHRLIRADLGARPLLASGESSRTLSGFSAPPAVSGSWRPGYYARTTAYSTVDLIENSSVVNPDALPLPPFAQTFGASDDLLHVTDIDGFTRTRDDVGNVLRQRLWVRPPGASAPVPVAATLTYDDLGQITRIARDDGVVVDCEYNPLGLRIRRTVTGDPSLCEPSDTAFLYDGANLIEERDLLNSGQVRARYYYGDDGDELIAGDLRPSPGTQLQRHYFLTDTVRSVIAITDAAGQVIERVQYDPWGQPTLTPEDVTPPHIARVTLGTNGLLVEFAETVLPAFATTPPDAGLFDRLLEPRQAFELRVNANLVGTTVTYRETNPASPFGSVFLIETSTPLTGNIELTLLAGTLQDEANLANDAQVLGMSVTGPPGTVLYQHPNPGPTSPAPTARSQLRMSFLFQGHVFDYDTGLLYCRARYYDPSIGLFLQRDPAGYADSVNQYAGFANNPVCLRDSTGTATDELGARLSERGREIFDEEGVGNKITGIALMMAGEVLQLGSGTANGMHLLGNPRSGTFGLMDVHQGGLLIAKDALVASDTGSLAYGLLKLARWGINGGLRAAMRMEGFTSKAAQTPGQASRSAAFLEAKGIVEMESDALAYSMLKHNASVMIREFREPAARLAAARSGLYRTKPWFLKDKTTGGIVTSLKEGYKGRLEMHTYVSDLDLVDIHIGGRRATAAEARRVIHDANRRFAQLWKAAGRRGIPAVPFRHGTHFGMVDEFGTILDNRPGSLTRIDSEMLAKIGHPGDSITLRIGGKGNIVAYETPRWKVHQQIVELEGALKEGQHRIGEKAIGWPDAVHPKDNWYRFEGELNRARAEFFDQEPWKQRYWEH